VEAARPAEASDLDRCHELLAQALTANRTRRGAALLISAVGTDPAILLERWQAGPHARLLVGTYDDAVVGLAAGMLERIGARLVGRVECCYVEPDARAVGVGGALIEGLIGWFAGVGCTDVDALALPGDRSTKQLLEAAGFKARLLVLHRPLR